MPLLRKPLMLQQYLPFTVLKRKIYFSFYCQLTVTVATVLTVYGIETFNKQIKYCAGKIVATVLTVYGIETFMLCLPNQYAVRLQQYLPFTVLKLIQATSNSIPATCWLQQYLPFTVLKHLVTVIIFIFS